MTALIQAVLVVVGLVASAHARLTAVLAGQPVSVPVLLIVAVVVVLALAALVLYLARTLLRDGLRLRPAMAAT